MMVWSEERNAGGEEKEFGERERREGGIGEETVGGKYSGGR